MDYSRIINNPMLGEARRKRMKRILQATTFVGRKLRDALEPTPTVVEGEFHVEPDVAPEQSSTQPEVEVTIITPQSDNVSAEQDMSSLVIPVESTSQQADTNNTTETSQNDIPHKVSELPFLIPIKEKLKEWARKLSTSQPTAEQSDETEPEDQQFRSGTYTNEIGKRSYKVYVPSNYHGQALPLVVMLHGCTQSPDGFAKATYMNDLAEEHGFFVVYPAQIFKANLGKCWNWFKEEEQQRDLGEPALIAGITRHIIETYNIDRQRVYVSGISAGGAMAMIMGVTYPDLYAAVGVHSGVAYGVAHNIPSGLAAAQGGGSVPSERLMNAPGEKAKQRMVPTIVFHGDQDSAVNPNNSDNIIEQWMTIRAERGNDTKPQITVHRGQVPNGHAYTRSVYHEESGPSLMEKWLVHGTGHAWSGGNPDVMFTDSQGPNASQEMVRFFYEHSHPGA
jgi:poly(hydroxyalkanoate) depolymerase family esterase